MKEGVGFRVAMLGTNMVAKPFKKPPSPVDFCGG